MPPLDFSVLKKKISIEQVLADQGLLDGLRRSGDRLTGPCPIHGGDNPGAFVVSLSKNLWRCFTRCDAGGDVVELARRLGGLTYPETARYLDGLAWQAPPPRVHGDAPMARPFRAFTRRLPLDPAAPMLEAKGIRPDTARRFEAGAYHGPGMLTRCIALRLHDPQGRPLGYAGRRLDPEQTQLRGKWVFPPGLPRNKLLYGYHHAGPPFPTGLVVVECPWGVMRLAQLGIPAVALLGTHLSLEQERLLLPAQRVLLMMDGDEAGIRAARRHQERLPQASLTTLPAGLDPDDLENKELEHRTRPFLL